MLLVAARRKELGLVENAQEFRNLADEIEEGAEPFDLLPRRMRRAGSIADEADHVDANFWQQRIEQFLAVLDMMVQHALDAIELGRCGWRHALASSSARSTRLSTLPEGFLGRLSRTISCFGTLKLA